jgi:hypothetical protein
MIGPPERVDRDKDPPKPLAAAPHVGDRKVKVGLTVTEHRRPFLVAAWPPGFRLCLQHVRACGNREVNNGAPSVEKR